MKNTKRIAFSGVAAALSVVIMYIAGITDILSLSGVLVAAFMILFIYIEYGTKTALSVYAAVSIISFLILPDKFSAAVYVLFAGYYPIIKTKLEKKPKFIAWTLKLVCFNAVLIAMMVASRYIASVEAELPVIEAAVFVLANLVFVMSDILAGRLIVLYIIKYRPRLYKRGLL